MTSSCVDRGLLLPLCTAAVVAGCCARPAPAPLPRGSAAAFARPPVVDGSRAACLLPPHVPAADVEALEDGSSLARCLGGRGFEIAIAGDGQVDPETLARFVERARERGGALRWIGVGACCELEPTSPAAPADRPCLRYEGNLCETDLGEITREVRAALAEDPETEGAGVLLLVELAGNLGPRCEADEAGCGPLPYSSGGGAHDPGARRALGPLPQYSNGSCRHDGDCLVSGCGNHCISWELGGAHETGTCEGYSFPEPVFCGCVEGSCGWFTQ